MKTTGLEARRKRRAAKAAKLKREAAKLRKAAQRERLKEQPLTRMRIPLDLGDCLLVRALSSHCGRTISGVIEGLMEQYTGPDGKFCMPADLGALDSGTAGQIDITLPELTAYQLKTQNGMRPGEVIEVLLGRLLAPCYDEREDEWVGSLVIDGKVILPLRVCLSPDENAARRADRRRLIELHKQPVEKQETWDPSFAHQRNLDVMIERRDAATAEAAARWRYEYGGR